MHFPPEQQSLISMEVEGMLEKQAISVVQPDKNSFLSQIFVIPKKDVGYRPVVNLKVLNKFITEEHFKMEGFHMVRDLAEPKDWMAKIDLKDVTILLRTDNIRINQSS